MNVVIQRVDHDFHFEAKGASGVVVNIDAAKDIGGHELGARPMEMILMGLGSCSAIDVILILRKQNQVLEDIRIEVNAKRADAVPAIFTEIEVKFYLKGNIKPEKAEQAVSLSMKKYCSVTAILEKTAIVTHQVFIEG